MLFNLGSYAFQLGKRCFSTLGVMISKTRSNAFEFRGRRIRSVDKDYSIFYATRRVPTLLGSNRKKLPLLIKKRLSELQKPFNENGRNGCNSHGWNDANETSPLTAGVRGLVFFVGNALLTSQQSSCRCGCKHPWEAEMLRY